MNAPVLALPIVILAALIPGVLALRLWGKRFAGDPLEYLFAGLAWGLLGIGWLALVLAELGAFSIGLLAGLWGALTVVLAGLGWLRRRKPPLRPMRAGADPQARSSKWEAALLALWTAAAVWLFFRPHEYLLGGADAGVYVNVGASIATSGSIAIHDEALTSLDPELYPALLRALPASEGAPFYLLPGFYVPGTPRGLVTPQFYALHPTWLALGYALGGLRAELWMTPLWALLGSLAVYFTVRRLWGRRAGFLALVGLSMMALQAWFARYPTAEMLSQYLFWTGAWALIAWLDRDEPSRQWAALAGVALGSLLLARIDMYVLLALPIAIGLYAYAAGRRQRGLLWFLIPFVLLAIHSLLHGALLSEPYVSSQIKPNRSLLVTMLALALAAGVAAVAGSLLARWIARRQGAGLPGRIRALGLAVSDFGRKPARWRLGGALLILVLAAYGYFLRPYLGQTVSHVYWYGGGTIPALDHENLLRLGWYLGPAGVILGAAGMAWMLLKGTDRRSAQARPVGFVLAAGLFFSLLYLWRIQANPHQIYAMRRYVPVVAPFFIVSAVFLLHWLYENLRGKARWVPVGLTLIWFFGIVISARGFVSQVDFRGLTGELDRLNAALQPHAVLVFNDPAPVGAGDVLGTPLRFLYGHDAFTLREPKALDARSFDEAVRRWQTSGRAVYWVSVPGGHPYPGSETHLAAPVEIDLTTRALENAYDHKPSGLFDARWQLSLSRVMDQPAGQ
jgi:hypothetical protein